MILVENKTSSIAGVSNLSLPNKAPRNIVFKVGINKVENEVWAELVKIQLIKSAIDAGELVVTVENDDEDVVSLKELTQNKAMAVVKATFDIELLKKWQENESRVIINKAIDSQLKLMDLSPEKETVEKFV
jgi:hypothetical protein